MSRSERYEKLYRLGLSDAEIGRRCGVTTPAVRMWRMRRDLVANLPYAPLEKSNAQELYDAGCNDREIARQIGVSPASVSKWRQKRGLPVQLLPDQVPPDELARRRNEILRHRAEGLTFAEIAASLGVTRNVVAGVIHRNS